MPKGWRPSPSLSKMLDDRIQKMSDPKNSETELKKWMIDRIGYEVLAYRDAIKSFKVKFDIFVNNGHQKSEIGRNLFCQY